MTSPAAHYYGSLIEAEKVIDGQPSPPARNYKGNGEMRALVGRGGDVPDE